MFVLLSIIEALPGGTYSLVLLKYWLVSMFHVLFISLFSDNIVTLSFGIFPFPRIKWHVQIHPNSWEGLIVKAYRELLSQFHEKMFPASTLLQLFTIGWRTWNLTEEDWTWESNTHFIIFSYCSWYFKLNTKYIWERERERQRQRQSEIETKRDRERESRERESRERAGRERASRGSASREGVQVEKECE